MLERHRQETGGGVDAAESGCPMADLTFDVAECELSESENISIRVGTSFEDAPLDRAAWDSATASLGGSVYMTWDWIRIWWEFYGRGRELRLIVCTAGEQIVGLIPIYIEDLRLWPLRLRVARLVGANIPPKVFDPPLARQWAGTSLDAVVRQLIEVDGCDLVSIGPVSSTLEAWQSLPEEVALTAGAARVEYDNSEVHTLFALPGTHSEYLKSLSRNEQKNRRKYELRTLKKEHEVAVQVISGPLEALIREFEDFAVLHAAQWRAEGKSGHFGSWPAGLAYNHALVEVLGPLDRVRFVRITADGVTLSNQYIFEFAGRWYWELPARLPNPQWDHYSLGPTGIVTMISEAIRAGVHSIQGGLGHYDYKLRLRAVEYPALRLRVYPSRSASRLRKRIFDLFRRGLGLCYHKIWYRRVMPRLPAALRRPQWKFWLRWDF